MDKLKAIIIDDETDSIKLLKLQLLNNCPHIDIVATFQDPGGSLDFIKKFPPDILFLDIDMPGMNGFELLERSLPLKFKVIFISAYNQYAIRAFKFSAIDYLLKPIDSKELCNAVEKIESDYLLTDTHIKFVKDQLNEQNSKKIAISTQNGIVFLNLEDIIYAESHDNYSKIYLNDGKNLLITKTLKDVQYVLEESHFLRIHRQYIINLNYILSFNKTQQLVIMKNNIELPIARNQKETLIQKFRFI